MTQRQIALPLARDFTSLHFYGEEQATDQGFQSQRGMIFSWFTQRPPWRQLVCLGLDICGIRRWEQMLSRTPEIATRAFTRDERLWARTQPERFTRLWTIKEAITKALGCGFAELAYQDVAVELATLHPSVRLPMTVPGALPGEQDLSALSWQLILFGDTSLTGALVCAWKQLSDTATLCQDKYTSKVVLELRSTTRAQQGTRKEKSHAERLEARQAAHSAASHLLPRHSSRGIDIQKTRSGQPLLQITEGNVITTDRVCLSLSHCSGWAAAALGGFSCQ